MTTTTTPRTRKSRISNAPNVHVEHSGGPARVVRTSDGIALPGELPSLDAARRAWHSFIARPAVVAGFGRADDAVVAVDLADPGSVFLREWAATIADRPWERMSFDPFGDI